MHAVFGTVEIEADRVAESETMLKEQLLPRVKDFPGFVSGTWTRSMDDTQGRSLIIFDNEESARAAIEAAKEMAPPPGAPIKFGTFELFQVVAQA